MTGDINQPRDLRETELRDPSRELEPGQQIIPHVLFLKLLVGGLAVAMVLGLAVIAVVMWLQLRTPPLPQLPATISLPEGQTAEAVTFGRNLLAVVTDAGEILVYKRDGSLQQRVTLDQPAQ